MAKRMIWPTMTENRRAWLTKLLDGETSPHGHGRATYDCRILGWSTFVVVAPDGRRITLEQAKGECPEFPLINGYHFADPTMEMITDAGRAALDAARPEP